MSDYRNVDDVISDATICVTIGDSIRPIDWSGIPEISDEISLNTDQGYEMMVDVTGISDDNSIFWGNVTQGYFTEKEKDWINAGDMVEFSRQKIAGIYKK